MGKNVTTIGDYAFASSIFSSSHATIEKLILPDKIENIGNYFVSNTIIKNVTIRSGCNRISKDILDNTGLQTINVESGNKIFSSDKGVLYETKYSSKGKVTDKVLVRCPKAQTFTTYSVPEDVTVIGESAFSNCKNLSRLVLPRKLKSLKKNALNVNIDTLVIPDKIKKIASQNGMYSHNISSLEVPSTVSYISSLWYDNLGVCFDLKSINVDANNKYFSSSDGVLYNKKQTKLIKIPYYARFSSYTVLDGTKQICNGACVTSTVKTLTIPKSVKKIGKKAMGNIVPCVDTIVCIKGSFADKYAKNHNIKREYINSGVSSGGSFAELLTSEETAAEFTAGVTSGGAAAEITGGSVSSGENRLVYIAGPLPSGDDAEDMLPSEDDTENTDSFGAFGAAVLFGSSSATFRGALFAARAKSVEVAVPLADIDCFDYYEDYISEDGYNTFNDDGEYECDDDFVETKGNVANIFALFNTYTADADYDESYEYLDESADAMDIAVLKPVISDDGAAARDEEAAYLLSCCDINNDSLVTAADYIMLRNYIYLDKPGIDSALDNSLLLRKYDVNRSGTVNIMDLSILKNIIMK